MTVGEALAEARYRAGLTIDEVSERTRIREAVIRCIEQDDYEACGGDLYVRGYVRAIAGAVGIDAQPLIRDYDAARAAVPEGAGGTRAVESAAAVPHPDVLPERAPSEDPAVTMFDLPVTPAAPAVSDATIADPGFRAAAADPRFTADDPGLTAIDPEFNGADLGFNGIDAGFNGNDPGSNGAGSWFDDADPGYPRTDPGLPAIDSGFNAGDWGFTAADRGFAAIDPGFTTAEWQYTVADQSLSAADPGFTTAGQGFTASEDFTAAHQAFNGADAAPAANDSLVVTPELVLAAAPAPAYGHPREPSPWRERIRGRRWVTLIVVLVAIVLAVAGVAGSHIISSLRHTPAANSRNAASGTRQKAGRGTGVKPAPTPAKTAQANPTPSAAPRPVTPVRSLPIALAEAFGPAGTADGDNPQSAPFAITHGSPSPWQTDWYTTADFGLLKHGTGLLLDMGKTVTITSVRIDLSAYSGADLQLRAGGTAVLDDLRVVKSASDAGGTVRLLLDSPVRARYLLIWFTLLPPNGTGRYQESIYRVVVNGRQ